MEKENEFEQNQEGQNVVEISPLKKGKRMLVFLGDFFLVFIIAFVLHNVAVNPIANAITSKDSRAEAALKANHTRDDILYGNKVLFYENDDTKYNLSSNVTYTFKRYISFYAFDEGEIYHKDTRIGHYAENEVLAHYYGDIKGNIQAYIVNLQNINNNYNYFVINDTKISLKDNIKNEVKLSFTSQEDMSEDGKTQYSNLQTIFLNLYQKMFNDISENDLSYNGLKYNDYQKQVTEYNNFYNNQNTISAFITFFISFAVIYIIFPLINKNGRTPTMAILKIDRIGTNNLFILKRGETLLNSVYALFFNMANLIFIPMTIVGFEGVFGLSYILVFSLISLLLIIGSLLTCIFSSFNRTICDMLSRSVLIKEEDLDSIYRARGYEI